MEAKARDYPQWFSLTKDGNRWHWVNRPLGIEQSFTFLDASTLPYGPFEYITRQTQGDFSLQDERDGTLWMDAGHDHQPGRLVAGFRRRHELSWNGMPRCRWRMRRASSTGR